MMAADSNSRCAVLAAQSSLFLSALRSTPSFDSPRGVLSGGGDRGCGGSTAKTASGVLAGHGIIGHIISFNASPRPSKVRLGEEKHEAAEDVLAAKARPRQDLTRLGERLLVCIIRPKHPNSRWLRRCCARRDKQHVQFRNEKRRSCARNCCDVVYPTIGVLPGVENIQIAIPTADVDALAFSVHEHVVRIGAQVDVCNWSAVTHGKRAEFRRISDSHDDMAA